MNKLKFIKWALPGLLLSCVLFETMPGSVGYFSKDLVTIPEGTVWNFFSPPVEGLAGSCLLLAGVVTIAAFVLAVAAACLHKDKLYNLISWCSLGAGALASAPYMVDTRGCDRAAQCGDPCDPCFLLAAGAFSGKKACCR